MMVRNEADIIEASVRHNLSCLDRLAVIDHGSFDGTSEILRQLAAESDAVRIIADPSVAYEQSTRITQAVREVIAGEGADFVFAIDADEFLKVPSREMLEKVLQNLPAEMHAMLHWQTYVADNFAVNAAVFSPSQATRRLKTERHGLNKVVVARHFGTRPRDVVAVGNHVVLNLDQPEITPRHARITPQIAAIAHVPVRSRRQLEKRIVIGYLAHLIAHPNHPHLAYHWRELYEEIRAGKAFDADRLRQIACNYGLARADWQPADAIPLVSDPIVFASELRYRADADLDTLQLLMRFCELVIGNGSRGVSPL